MDMTEPLSPEDSRWEHICSQLQDLVYAAGEGNPLEDSYAAMELLAAVVENWETGCDQDEDAPQLSLADLMAEVEELSTAVKGYDQARNPPDEFFTRLFAKHPVPAETVHILTRFETFRDRLNTLAGSLESKPSCR